MKKYKDIGNYDFSDYAEEITGDALFEINGGAQIENSIEAQANAQVGDTGTNSKGETHTIYQEDIDWAKDIIEKRGETSRDNNTAGSSGVETSNNRETDSSKSKNNIVANSYGTKYRSELDATKQKFIYDFENKKINVKIDDLNALKKAAEVLSDLYVEGYTVNAIDINGNIVSFNRYSEISQFVSSCKSIWNPEDGNFSTWFNKQNGEILTEREAIIQRNFGIGEMIAGPVISIGACEVTCGQSVLEGLYIMSDGAVMIDYAKQGIKQQSGSFFTTLIAPVPVYVNDFSINMDIPNPSNVMPKWR